MRILLAEDEEAIAGHVAGHLERDGYSVTTCRDGAEAWDIGANEPFDAVVLDLGLPSLDGLTLLRRWRADGITIPVIVLTARGSWMERVDGFDAGADDYLPKPFRIEELKARLRAILRRAGSGRPENQALAGGRLVLRPELREVRLDGAFLQLTPSEYRALECLAAAEGRPVDAWEIARRALDRDDDKAGNAAEVLVNRLRRKLGEGIVLNRRGFGYHITMD